MIFWPPGSFGDRPTLEALRDQIQATSDTDWWVGSEITRALWAYEDGDVDEAVYHLIRSGIHLKILLDAHRSIFYKIGYLIEAGGGDGDHLAGWLRDALEPRPIEAGT